MKLAVYTTIYRKAVPFLKDWFLSIQSQTDQQFDLWIGLHGLEVKHLDAILASKRHINYVTACSSATCAGIRQEALSRIVEGYDAIVLVDCDDILHPSRVAAARECLNKHELAGCALRLVNQNGTDARMTFGLPDGRAIEDVFPRNNIYGFSNSSFCTSLLRRCLPIPAEVILVDWLLATRSWLLGARLTFDNTPRMDYRQHPDNTARVRFPVTAEQTISDTIMVRKHYQCLLAEVHPDALPDRRLAVTEFAADVSAFEERVAGHPHLIAEYVKRLNAINPAPMWWTCVAYPPLNYMWS